MMPVTAAARPALPWPTMGQYLALKRTRASNVGRVLKTAWLYAQTLPLRGELAHAVARVPEASALLAHNPRLFLSAFDSGFDTRLSLRERFRLLALGLSTVVPRLCTTRALSTGLAEWRVWADAETGCEARLGTNWHTPQEGIWMLTLLDAEQLPLFMLSFSVVGSVAYVGAVQGAVPDEAGRERIRRVTKALHGLRPPHAVLEVFRALMIAWGVPVIQGVDTAHQVKAAEGSRAHEAVHFDYRAFWQEAGGTQGADAHWQLPLALERRPLEEVDARKRAMYRRRYLMLDALAQAIRSDWD